MCHMTLHTDEPTLLVVTWCAVECISVYVYGVLGDTSKCPIWYVQVMMLVVGGLPLVIVVCREGPRPPVPPAPPDIAVNSSLVPPMLDSLPCTEETQAILAGYIVQGEFGDYDVADHTPGYLDDYPFVLGRVSLKLEWV